jgi:branched-chain amino acid transport system ATP-binding protein
MSGEVLLQVENLTRQFCGVKAVNCFSFEVNRGEVFSLIGPNGAGKTTVFNLISRLYVPTSGRILFKAQEISAMPAHTMARLGIARTFQNIELFEYASVLQNMLIGRHTHMERSIWQELLFTQRVRDQERAARHKVEEVIDFLNLQPYRDTLVAGLPYGVRKIVELARALCCEPELLLLDEPSSGLNVEETTDLAFWIADITQQLGVTVLMVEHDMSLVGRASDRVLAMHHGERLAIGTPEEVQADPAVVESYLGKAVAP